MLTETVYSVRIKYGVDGRGSAGVRQLGNEVRSLGRETNRTSGLFRGLGTAVVGAFGARAGYRAMIGFNAAAEDTKVTMAGMLALAKKTGFKEQLEATNKVYGDLQKAAATLPGQTAEYTRMASFLALPITQAGLGMQDLEDMTKSAVVAAKALGLQWDQAGRDVQGALAGNFNSRDMLTGPLLGAMGFSGEQGREKFNAMDPAARAETLKQALAQKGLLEMAQAQGQTFNGVVSTLQDTIGQFFGKVGLPLFKAITAEVKQWNAWFDANQDKVDAFATRLADGLVTGFRTVKDVLSFLVDHADLLMTIGKVWAAVKLGGMLGGALGANGPGGGIAGIGMKAAAFANFFRGARDRGSEEGGTFFGGGYQYTPAGAGRQPITLKGAIGALPQLGAAVGAGLAAVDAGQMLGEGAAKIVLAFDSTTQKTLALERSMAALDEATRRAAQGKEGLAASAPLTNLAGYRDDLRQQANVIGDFLRARQAGDLATMQQKIDAATSLGLTGADMTRANVTSLNARAAAAQGEYGTVNLLGQTAWEMALPQLTDYQKQTLDMSKAQLEVMTYLTQQVAKHEAFSEQKIVDIMQHATQDPSGKKMAAKPNVNITVQRIEVASDDPDRFAFGLVESFKDAVKNPSQSKHTTREG